jgi:hypothetical protein
MEQPRPFGAVHEIAADLEITILRGPQVSSLLRVCASSMAEQHATPRRCNRTGCETIAKKRFVQKTRVDQRSM